jgi:hypothetical protein
MQWVYLTLLVVSAYSLPGYLVTRLIDVRGIDRWSRAVLAIGLSLVLVPYIFVTVGNLRPFLPGLGALLILVALLVLGRLLLRGRRRPVLEFVHLGEEPPGRSNVVEILLVTGFILAFAAITNMPRLGMLVLGDQTISAGTWDEHFHLAQLTSVARSGIPPRHYLLPDLDLAYYYWSWIYPAALSNQTVLAVPLARAMAVHAFVQDATFLFLVYLLLRLNIRGRWGRWAGLSFVTVFGGFDFFVTMSESEWWQAAVPWLRSGNQISQFATLYMWVPQHVAGAMAFVLALILWRNVRGAVGLRIGGLAVLLSFMLGTSPFILLATLLMIGMWTFLHRRPLWRMRHHLPILALAAAGLFLAGGWRQILLSAQHAGEVALSDFRVPLLETLRGSHAPFPAVDRWLTLVFSPLVAGWIGLIEIGLPFILYLLWAAGRGSRRGTVWTRVLTFAPAALLLLTFVVKDVGAGGNLVMRGMIPAQILIAISAATYLDPISSRIRVGSTRAVIGILVVAGFAIIQSVSWVIDLDGLSYGVRQTLKNLTWIPTSTGGARLVAAGDPGWPGNLAYIHWLNAETPVEALVLEAGGPGAMDEPRYRLLERLRYLTPKGAETLGLIERDHDFLSEGALGRLEQSRSETDVLSAWEASPWSRTGRPAYLVSWDGERSDLGAPLYRDDFVFIYQVH